MSLGKVKQEDSVLDVVSIDAPVATPSSSRNHASGLPDYLQSLSKSQLAAATHPATSCLQILAGPGSGKTRVLTSRVAWLVLDSSNLLKPQDILVVTFTNKAANEMKHRLVQLIGKSRVDNLVIGTFHSVCAKYLRKYGRLISLPNNFTIIDSDDAKKLLKTIIKELNQEEANMITFKPEQAMSEISKAKAKEMDPVQYSRHAEEEAARGHNSKDLLGGSNSFKTYVAVIYEMYQAKLVDSNALDFDDLLVYGVKLFREEAHTVQNIRHVLVDEFQDTNVAQYELMRLVALSSRAVSIVGDPDQSIYGWRSAEVKNLDKMTKEFKGTQQARLEENYRSTGSILELALKVVQQDSSRVEKGLYASHPRGPPVTLKHTASAQLEGAYIASEIKRIIAHSGGMLSYDDFVILLRFNFLSRAIEAELQASGIASRMMGGHKFFDRMEVKDLLAYLALADNPGFTPAFVRVVNVPKRGFGEKSISDILNLATTLKCKPMELAERIASGAKVTGIKPAMKKGLKELVDAVLLVRKAANSGTAVPQLLEMLIKQINYENYLKAQPDYESRWGNVMELVAFSTVLSQNSGDGLASQVSVPVEEVLSHTLSAKEDAWQNKSLSDDDDDFEEVLIAPSSQISATEPTRAAVGHNMANKRQVIDLSLSDEEDEDAKQGESAKPGSSNKRTRTTPQMSASIVKGEDPMDQHESAAHASAGASLLDILDSTEDVKPFPINASKDDEDDEETKSPLRIFLEASILATDLDGTSDDKDDAKKRRVTLSTCHAAKGLEWPVVFIPAVEDGNYPSYRCEEAHEIAEERRLLYVAITRAESLLYISHASERMQGGDKRDKVLSSFITAVASQKDGGKCAEVKSLPFCSTRPGLDEASVEVIAAVTGRTLPSKMALADSIREWSKKAGRDMDKVDELNTGRMTGFGSYSSYGSSGKYGSTNTYGNGTSNHGSQTGFGRHSAADALADARRGTPMSTYGSFSTPRDAPVSNTGLYSGFQRASSLSGGENGAGGRGRQPLLPPSRQTVPVPRPPSFTDSVRLKARPEDSVALARADGTAPRLRADLNSFQQAHSDGITSLLTMLPPDTGSASVSTANGSRSMPIVVGDSNRPSLSNNKRRLGMSRRF